jgi:hypothetical protein
MFTIGKLYLANNDHKGLHDEVRKLWWFCGQFMGKCQTIFNLGQIDDTTNIVECVEYM